MTVTATRPPDSRNVLTALWSGCDCGALMMFWYREVGGERVGDWKPLEFHCTACHSRDHNACTGCGECLPDWKGPYGARWFGGRRSDLRYHSNACRQRAYRKRKQAVTP